MNDPESMARFSRAVFGLQDWNRGSLEHSAIVGGPIDEITSRATGAGGPSLTLIKKSGSARAAVGRGGHGVHNARLMRDRRSPNRERSESCCKLSLDHLRAVPGRVAIIAFPDRHCTSALGVAAHYHEPQPRHAKIYIL